jgi:phospholipid/cholesterol/gamma-HCH transport system ATP-binding protein
MRQKKTTRADAEGVPPPIRVENLEMAYGDTVIQRDLSFSVNSGDIFVVMGGSGCGKSTLLRHLIGLKAPARGRILYDDVDLWACEPAQRDRILRRVGVLYQGGALWSDMSLAENIALPLHEYTALSKSEIDDIVELKLALVGLAGYGQYFPSELSGGMQKRAGLARAMALDPAMLFFDEPSAGLDPVSARRLDDLILELRDSLGATIVVVTHELASIFAIATDSVFLDASAKTIIARGDPNVLLEQADDPRVHEFLTRQRQSEAGNSGENRW